MIASVAAGFFALDILLLLAFQGLNRDYGLFTHAVSDYGVGKTARLFRAYVLVASIATPLLAWLFWQSRTFPPAIPVYLLLLTARRSCWACTPTTCAAPRGPGPARSTTPPR